MSRLCHGNTLTTSEGGADDRTKHRAVTTRFPINYLPLNVRNDITKIRVQHTSGILAHTLNASELKRMRLRTHLDGNQTIEIGKVGFESQDNVITVVVDEAMSGEVYYTT